MFKEFREFAMRGNVMDMAIGIIIGAAFGKIVTSFVQDILMPPIGMLMGGVDFTNYFVTLSGQVFPTLAAAKEAGVPTINYGVFLNTVFDFLIVAFAIFLMIRQLNKLKRNEDVPVVEKQCPECLLAIPIHAKRCAHCTTQLLA